MRCVNGRYEYIRVRFLVLLYVSPNRISIDKYSKEIGEAKNSRSHYILLRKEIR